MLEFEIKTPYYEYEIIDENNNIYLILCHSYEITNQYITFYQIINREDNEVRKIPYITLNNIKSIKIKHHTYTKYVTEIINNNPTPKNNTVTQENNNKPKNNTIKFNYNNITFNPNQNTLDKNNINKNNEITNIHKEHQINNNDDDNSNHNNNDLTNVIDENTKVVEENIDVNENTDMDNDLVNLLKDFESTTNGSENSVVDDDNEYDDLLKQIETGVQLQDDDVDALLKQVQSETSDDVNLLDLVGSSMVNDEKQIIEKQNEFLNQRQDNENEKERLAREKILERIAQSVSNDMSSVEVRTINDEKKDIIKEKLLTYLNIVDKPFNLKAFFTYIQDTVSPQFKITETDISYNICQLIKYNEVNIDRFNKDENQKILKKYQNYIRINYNQNLPQFLQELQLHNKDTIHINIIDLAVYLKYNNYTI